MCFRIPGSGASRNKLKPRRHDDVALFIVPAVAEVEFDRRRTAPLEHLSQFRLIVLFENFGRSEIISKDANVPFVAVEISEGNSGVVLHNRFAVIENEIADAIESLFEHQVGRGFEKTAADAELAAKFEETGRRETAVGNIGGEIIKRLFLPGVIVDVLNPHAGTPAGARSAALK